MAEPLDSARIALLMRRRHGAQSRQQVRSNLVAMRVLLDPAGDPLKLREVPRTHLRLHAMPRSPLQLIL
jgi:hypothetical protein